ncbi:hypothetical protein EVA_21392, partial [gut metagenome]
YEKLNSMQDNPEGQMEILTRINELNRLKVMVNNKLGRV